MVSATRTPAGRRVRCFLCREHQKHDREGSTPIPYQTGCQEAAAWKLMRWSLLEYQCPIASTRAQYVRRVSPGTRGHGGSRENVLERPVDKIGIVRARGPPRP